MDERILVCVQKGWNAPATCIVVVVTPTEVASWSKTDLEEYKWNIKELYSLFIALSSNEFNRLYM